MVCFLVIGYANILVAQDLEKQLRWNLEPDTSYEVELNQTTGIKTNIQNRTQEIGNEMTLLMNWTVSSAEDSTYKINQSITRIRLTVTAPSKGGVQITSIDTGSDEKTTEFGMRLLEQIKPLIETSFLVTMTDRGEIKEVEIPKESMEAIRSAPASMQLRQVISEQGLKELIGQSAIVFPQNRVKPGDQWESRNSVKNEFATITKKNQLKYDGSKEIDGSTFESVTLTTGITTSDISEGNSIESFVGSGTILFSNENDTLLDSKIKNEMTTIRKYRDQKIKSTVNTDVSMKVTKAND